MSTCLRVDVRLITNSVSEHCEKNRLLRIESKSLLELSLLEVKAQNGYSFQVNNFKMVFMGLLVDGPRSTTKDLG